MIRIRYNRCGKTTLSVVCNVIIDDEHSRLLFTSFGKDYADIIIYYSSSDRMVDEFWNMMEKGYANLDYIYFTHVDDL